MLIKRNGTEGITIPNTLKEVPTMGFIAGVDAGSTQTRVALASKQDFNDFSSEQVSDDPKGLMSRLCMTYVIPSTYASVSDEREIAPRSNYLHANLDSRLMRVKTAAEQPMFNSLRVIRGDKLRDVSGVVPRYLDSATQKVDNVIFYVNIIDALGYAILQRAAVDGVIPQTAHVAMVVSVRPKEMNSISVKKLESNLVGTFLFLWGNRRIEIVIDNLDLTTEPEAQIQGTEAVAGLSGTAEDTALADRLYSASCYMHIEGGGSSIGVEVVRDGGIVEQCSSTFPLGGNYLVRQVIDRVREATGRTPSEASVQEAVKTCLLRNGNNQEDIASIVAAAKDQVAMDIVERVRHQVIDVMTDLTMNDMEFISVCGRLFNEDGAGNCIAEYMKSYITQLSPHTELVHLKDNRIPQGNLLIGVSNEVERMAAGNSVFGLQSYAPSYNEGVENSEATSEEE